MEHLENYEAWVRNEKELLPLLEKIRPLLEERYRLEALEPKLGLLRGDRTLPGELPPPKLAEKDLIVVRAATKFVGTNESLVGDPDRPVPTKDEALRKLARAAKNKKRHEKEKANKKAKRATEPPKDNMEVVAEKPPPSE